MFGRFRIGLLVCSIPLFSAACLTPIVERPWVAVSSPHFEILSTMKAEEAVALAEDLERFRALIHTVIAARRRRMRPRRIRRRGRRSKAIPRRTSVGD